MNPRYAIYFAPSRGSPLWRFGSATLGYDADSGRDAAFPEGRPYALPDWRERTEEPRRYGFHATLKAPVHLKDGTSELELLREAAKFSRERASFRVEALQVALLGSFVALVPSERSPELDDLAADCVRRFDRFRAPMTESDRSRRLAKPLTDRQATYLDEWGYPHVFEEFRFHMTLTGSLPAERREEIRADLAARYAELNQGLPVDSIAIFRQESREERFRILERLPFRS